MGKRKRKRKLTAAEKAEKKRRRKEYMTIFLNGKQKRVKRPETVEGIPVDEFIRNNADPIWLLQNEMYEELHQWEQERDAEEQAGSQSEPAPDCKKPRRLDAEGLDQFGDIPF